MNCTVVRFSAVPFCADGGDLCADGGDLCEADNGKLSTARSRMPQLPSHFTEAFHAEKTVFPSCVRAKGEKAPTFPS